MRVIRKFACLIACLIGIVVVAPDAAALDLVDVANLVRSQHCGDEPVQDKPLRRSKELDIAAQRMADGNDMALAIATVGYRARSSASVRIRSPKGRNDAIAKTLAERFCHHVANPDFVAHVLEVAASTDVLLVTCRSGGRSALAVNALAAAGFKNVYNIIDGVEGDKVHDPDSAFNGKRMKNGWKNSAPWVYSIDPEKVILEEATSKREK